jgi:hypothetical protein
VPTVEGENMIVVSVDALNRLFTPQETEKPSEEIKET